MYKWFTAYFFKNNIKNRVKKEQFTVKRAKYVERLTIWYIKNTKYNFLGQFHLFTSTGSVEYPFQRKFCVSMDLTEICVVLFPSLTKSVTGLKWIRARLQTPFLQGPWGRSTTQEDRDRSAPSKPSSLTEKKNVQARLTPDNLMSVSKYGGTCDQLIPLIIHTIIHYMHTQHV